MTTKAQQAKEPTTTILYDNRLAQAIPLDLEKNGKEYRVVHHLDPLTAERYFTYLTAVEKMVARLKKPTVSLTDPQYQIWLDLATSREGYKERADWKEATHQNDAVAATAALLHVQVLDDSDITADSGSDLYDDESLTDIHFMAMQSGALLELIHSFREETKAEADEHLAIEAGLPSSLQLASAEKLPKGERLYRLGLNLLKDHSGYADGSEIPPWHLAATTEAYFLRQGARLGKYLKG